MTHLGYILAAYLASAGVLLGITIVTVLDLRVTRRKLQKLEAERQRRRGEVAR